MIRDLCGAAIVAVVLLTAPPYIQQTFAPEAGDVTPTRDIGPTPGAGEIAPIRPRCHNEYIASQADGGRWTAHCVHAGSRP